MGYLLSIYGRGDFSQRIPARGRDEGWCVRQRRELLQELRKVRSETNSAGNGETAEIFQVGGNES